MEDKTKNAKLNESEQRLSTLPISKLFWIYVGNGLLYTFIQVIQMQVDGVFVGNGIGAIGLASVALTNPIIIFSSSASLLFVMGGEFPLCRSIGQKSQGGSAAVLCDMHIDMFSYIWTVVNSVADLCGPSCEIAGCFRRSGAVYKAIPDRLSHYVRAAGCGTKCSAVFQCNRKTVFSNKMDAGCKCCRNWY